jgi:hypothetical protein
MHGVADPVAEDGSESDEAPAKVLKCSGKRLDEWKTLKEINGSSDRYCAKAIGECRVLAKPVPTLQARYWDGGPGSRRLIALQAHAKIWLKPHLPVQMHLATRF